MTVTVVNPLDLGGITATGQGALPSFGSAVTTVNPLRSVTSETVSRLGAIGCANDRRAQAQIPSVLRSDTPNAIQLLALRGSV